MNKKVGNLFEEHIEKIIFAATGLVCAWFLVTRVILSPNYIEYDNKKFAPGSIDTYISRQAELLEQKLSQTPKDRTPYQPQTGKFVALLQSAISNIDINIVPSQPGSAAAVVKGKYHLPSIGTVSDVDAEHIRAVAYVPVGKINEASLYRAENCEPNDIDFVTVGAKFDVAQLYKNFHDAFAGDSIPAEWRDPCLAIPVFAAVQLQRQELLANGGWGDWQVVPRTKIDSNRKMFEITEDVENLPPGGIHVRILRFNDIKVAMTLLQPAAYMIASAKEEWLPPSLHKEFVKNRQDMEIQEKREAKVTEKKEKEREREDARKGRPEQRTGTKPGPTAEPMDGQAAFMQNMQAATGAKKTPAATAKKSRIDRKTEKEHTVKSKETPKGTNDISDKFDEVLITPKSDFGKMQEPLLFWAHDDTVEPGKSYRYRIRLGVFNPIGGTDQFAEEDIPQRNKVILWSDFSDETEAVTIPQVLYFFPIEIQEAAKIVTVQVSRYVMGYWYSMEFMVNPGEVIGKTAKYEAGEAVTGVKPPEAVDYSTGAVLVDVAGPVKEWSGDNSLRPRSYFNMLYSFDGTTIEQIPIKSKYWPDELTSKFNEIRKSEKEPKEPLREWGSTQYKYRRIPGIGTTEEPALTGEEAFKKQMEQLKSGGR